MANFIAQPTVIREIAGVGTVAQAGDQASVNGIPAQMVLGSEIVGNPLHYLRAPLASIMPRLESGDVAAIVLADIHGKPAQILITAEQFGAGAPERARYAAWRSEIMANEARRQAGERAYDLVNNEGGEGYNPHRSGGERTYTRVPRRDRDYPEGA